MSAAIPWLGSVMVILMTFGLFRLGPAMQASFSPFEQTRAAARAPRLIERPLVEAREAARLQGVETELAGTRPTQDAPKGYVVEQQPEPGAALEPGAPVRLTVSAGLRPPDVRGKSLDEARVDLVIAGWNASPNVRTRPTLAGRPNAVLEQHPGPDEAADRKGSVELVVAGPNLTYRRPAVSSQGAPAPEAVDGDDKTVAWNPTSGPAWIEVDLGAPSTVSSVALRAAVRQPGPVTVEVWGWDAAGRFSPLQLFVTNLTDGAMLSAMLPQPATQITRLRVATTTGAGQVGWREIAAQ